MSATRVLEGRVAVVTGASGGIGRAIALAFAQAGANVVVHGHSRRSAAEEAASAAREVGVKSMVALAELATEAGRQSLVETAWNWQSRVDIWVNNAGADVLTGDAAHWSFDRKLELLWQVDVLGTIRLSREVGERMKALSSGGVILNIGWDQAEQGMGGESGEMFGAVKGAVTAFSRSLAQSLAPHVRVNTIAPGWIRTQWAEGASEYWQERAVRQSLRGRWGTPEDVAAAAVFLASPAADFLTGQVIKVNGGFRYE